MNIATVGAFLSTLRGHKVTFGERPPLLSGSNGRTFINALRIIETCTYVEDERTFA